VDVVCKKKRQNDGNNVRRISHLTELLEKESQVAEMEDVGTFVKILAKAKPHVKELHSTFIVKKTSIKKVEPSNREFFRKK
jgi:hypothetical protein